jgi:CO/xanthine dehydrogenase Mo-binding subunit
MSQATLPSSIVNNPKLSQWLGFTNLPKVTICSGKVELGQGIQTSLQQIAADELGLDLNQVHWIAGDTHASPDEWYTAGSLSIENGGSALKVAMGFARTLCIDIAAQQLQVPKESIKIANGIFSSSASSQTISYAQIAPLLNIDVDIVMSEAIANTHSQVQRSWVGQNIAREDLLPKLSGAAFIHDFSLPNMHHARMIRAKHVQSSIIQVDIDKMKALPGVEQVVHSGSFLAIVGSNEALLVNAQEKAQAFVQWQVPGYVAPQLETEAMIMSLPSGDEIAYENGTSKAAVKTIKAKYSRPFLAHASIGPACAVAEEKDGLLTVWSHTQGSHLLKNQIAVGLRQEASTVKVVHLHGAGCYGHNSADDVAFDAAFIAKMTGLPVRVQWGREEELNASPFGAPGVIEFEAGLDDSGKIVNWQSEIWSPTHIHRPGWSGKLNLLGAWMIDPPHPLDETKDNPLPQGGGLRNAITLYNVDYQKVRHHMIPQAPLRTSALRGLGATLNIFAMESFMDEIAEELGVDSLDFRKQHLQDPRSIKLLDELAKLANWTNRHDLPEGTGLGMGFARYKNTGAYCGVMVQLRAEEKIYIDHVWAVCDAGEIINPDGFINQIEGGIIQAISWTLKEMVTWDTQGVTSDNWDNYPILMFDEVPMIEVKLLNQPGVQSLGGGEAAGGPVGAAIANALVQALGIRARHLPLTPERLAQAIE